MDVYYSIDLPGSDNSSRILVPPTLHLQRRLSTSMRSDLRDIERATAQRMEIIEKRRNRLAEQHSKVHAVQQLQKVRVQQASLNKMSTITESIDAASLKRQARIELQKKQWQSNVLNAKRIAARAETARVEQSKQAQFRLAQKIKHSNFRRQQLLGVSKSTLVVSTTTSNVAQPLNKVGAALRLQRFFYMVAMKQTVAAFLGHALSRAELESKEFEECAMHVHKRATRKIADRLVALINRNLNSSKQIDARVFISAVMTAAHPQDIFTEQSTKVEELINHAKHLVDVAEKSMANLSGSKYPILNSYSLSRRIHAAYVSYQTAFEAWREQDAERLVQMVIDHYHELDAFWAELQSTRTNTSDVLQGIAGRQKMLRDRIRNMSGDVALEELERQRIAREIDINQSPEVLFANQSTTTTDSVLIRSRNSSRSTTDNNTAEAEVSTIDEEQGASAVRTTFSNIELAHAIAVNSEYRMEPDRSGMRYAIQAATKAAFFDQLRQREEMGSYLPWFIELMTDVREKLLSLVSEKGALHANIIRLLDLTYIQQQLEQNALNFFDLFRSLQKLAAEMCAPVRDQEVHVLQNHTTVVDFMAHYIEVVDLMKLDHVNFQLTAARPALMKHIVEYERSQFREKLTQQPSDLPVTSQWLHAAAKKLQETAESRNIEGVVLPKVRFESVWNDAFIDLLFSNTPLSDIALPETLYLDEERLTSHRSSVENISHWAAFLAHIRTHSLTLRRNGASLKKLFEQHADTPALQLDIAEFLSAVAVFDGEINTTTLQPMLEKVQTGKDPVSKIIMRRVEAVIRARMTANTFKVETLKSMGLDLVVAPLDKLTRDVTALCTLNKQVYAEWYDEMLARVV